MLEKSKASQSLRRHMWVALASVLVLGGGLVAWAAVTEVAGAVIAHGVVAVEGGSKRVQHQEGGIVSEILAKNQDEVEAGQVLLRLNGTTTAASLAVVNAQLGEALALEARLTAESTDAEKMVRPDEQLVSDDLFAAQDLLRRTRAATRKTLVSRLQEQIGQTEVQIEGLEAQYVAADQQLVVLTKERDDLRDLLAQGLVEASRPNAILREVARLEGEKGRLVAEIAAARTVISEKRLEIDQAADEFRSTALEELQAVRQKIAELRQQKIAAEDRLARLEVRAPLGGIVHESKVQTVGGVISAGDVLMFIVPQSVELAIESRVSSMDVDKLHIGQDVTVRFSSLDARRTPELQATVRSVSADLSHDAQTGQSFFLVKVAVPEAELSRLPEGTRLVPGMPAEVFIQTGSRTVLAYLVHPFTEQMNQAFRESD